MGTLHFRLFPLRLTFRARETIAFPSGAAANRLRGAFGAILHKLDLVPMFAPTSEEGPSGLVDQLRPFVFRASHLDGRTFATGETFHFDFHWFDLRRESLELVIRAFRELTHEV